MYTILNILNYPTKGENHRYQFLIEHKSCGKNIKLLPNKDTNV